MDEVSYPRQEARTLRFSLGLPRNFAVCSGANRILFLRSSSGTDRVNRLWALDLGSMTESVLVEPSDLLEGGDEDLPPEERARRERAREAAGGIVSFSTGAEGRAVAFTLSGRLFAIPAFGADPVELTVAGPVIQPRIDPSDQRITYVSGGALRVIEIDGQQDRALVEPDGPEVTWGLAEFVAGEEMGRFEGFWWSPVQRWWIADPANPGHRPSETPYPAAGTPNSDVSLWLVSLEGGRTEVVWDRAAYEYLTRVNWGPFGEPVIQVMSRDQRRALVLSVAEDGTTRTLRAETDESWIELIGGAPCLLPDGRLLHAMDDYDADTRCLAADGEPLTPPGLQVRSVIEAGEQGVVFSGAEADATQLNVFRWENGRTERLSPGPGVHSAVSSGDLMVLTSRTLDRMGARTAVLRNGEVIGEIASAADEPSLEVKPQPFVVGARRLNTTLLLPRGHVSGSRLPVIMDPYGGPHAQRVVASRGAYATSQWIADQGFAVVVADGRGSPGRGPAWEKSIRGDLSRHALDDQVEALQALGADHPELDLERVGIRGASFGGYLSALAVLRRPDVFHAAVATASVTDWRLYDTFYTERYLGHPDQEPDNYARSSLLDDAPKLERPLMLVHGMADDNVVVAHSLRLSGALLAAGKAHQLLPLTGVTHMTAPDEVVAENLLSLEIEFFKAHLGSRL
jgi:dipeptidyl-peptidase-4